MAHEFFLQLLFVASKFLLWLSYIDASACVESPLACQ
jgi:hypothetical protein